MNSVLLWFGSEIRCNAKKLILTILLIIPFKLIGFDFLMIKIRIECKIQIFLRKWTNSTQFWTIIHHVILLWCRFFWFINVNLLPYSEDFYPLTPIWWENVFDWMNTHWMIDKRYNQKICMLACNFKWFSFRLINAIKIFYGRRAVRLEHVPRLCHSFICFAFLYLHLFIIFFSFRCLGIVNSKIFGCQHGMCYVMIIIH